MERCNPKGRDCIEKNSAATFNCSTTCVGIYADVIPRSRRIEGEIEGEGEKGHELDREKYRLLIAEYRKFKSTSVQHSSFSSTETSDSFGK